MPVFTLETNDQTNNECLPKFVPTDNACSRVKTANVYDHCKTIAMHHRDQGSNEVFFRPLSLLLNMREQLIEMHQLRGAQVTSATLQDS